MHLLGTLNKIANQVTRAIIIVGDINKGGKRRRNDIGNEYDEEWRGERWRWKTHSEME